MALLDELHYLFLANYTCQHNQENKYPHQPLAQCESNKVDDKTLGSDHK